MKKDRREKHLNFVPCLIVSRLKNCFAVLSCFRLCGFSMTAQPHIQHAQLSAFSFISRGGRVSQKEIASWCWDFSSNYSTVHVDHTAWENKNGAAVQMHARVPCCVMLHHPMCSYHRNYLTFNIVILFLICSIKAKQHSFC